MDWKQLLCTIGRHGPDRPNVTWDGFRYVGQCKRCGADIMRDRHSVWRSSSQDTTKVGE